MYPRRMGSPIHVDVRPNLEFQVTRNAIKVSCEASESVLSIETCPAASTFVFWCTVTFSMMIAIKACLEMYWL